MISFTVAFRAPEPAKSKKDSLGFKEDALAGINYLQPRTLNDPVFPPELDRNGGLALSSYYYLFGHTSSLVVPLLSTISAFVGNYSANPAGRGGEYKLAGVPGVSLRS